MSTNLYMQIAQLIETAPDLSRALDNDARLWLARVRAAIKDTGDLGNSTAFTVAMMGYKAGRLGEANTIIQCLFDALADQSRHLPALLQGAFIPAGNAHDAVLAVSRIVGEAKSSVMFVDPYADATILENYALFVSEGVSVEVLADAADVKPTLKPAALAWTKQYAASRPLTIRLSSARALHDRLIVVDKASCYVVGQSFNALAARAPTSINRITDADTGRRKVEAPYVECGCTHLDPWGLMITSARFVIAVPDLARSAAFYRDVLGFVIHEIGDPGWRFYERDAVMIMAGECADATPPRELGDHSYFAYLEVDDIDALYARVSAAGAETFTPPADESWGMREFGLRTIDGHRIRFGQRLQA